MINLLIVTGVVETATGLGLLAVPSLIASLLLGAPLEGAVGLVVGRVCGAALLSLGIACLLAHDESGPRASNGLIVAILVYDITVTALLAFSLVGLRLIGIALWPAILLHTGLAIWCIVCLRRKSATNGL